MEKITEKYYLGSNKNTLILYEKKISQASGTETYKKVGYYATIDAVYNSLLEKEIREDVSIINNIEKISNMIKELKEFTISHSENN